MHLDAHAALPTLTARRLGRAIAGLAAGAALALPAVGLVGGAPALAEPAASGIVISEVNQNQDPADWVELTNTSDQPIDISGWALKDDDDSRDYTLPTGTVIAPGEFLVLTQDEAGSFGFGLGKEDTVRLFAPDGTLVDELAWSGHSVTSYIRIEGEVVMSAELTPGAENSGAYQPEEIDTAPVAGQDQVRITEVSSNQPEGAEVAQDFLEVTNLSAEPVDISGWGIRDDDDTRTPYLFPAGTVLAGGERMVVSTLDFGLGRGDMARLYNPNDALVQTVSWPEGEHAMPSLHACYDPAITSGAAFDEAVRWELAHGMSPGQVNNCLGVRINETNSSGDDFIELKNVTDAPIDISGFSVLDDDDTHEPARVPAGTILGPGELYLFTATDLGWGLGNNDEARLFDADGNLLEIASWSEHTLPSIGLNEDGVRAVTGAATPGEPNDFAVPEPVQPDATVPTTGEVIIADAEGVWSDDLSGLDMQVLADGTEILWAVNNNDGSVSRLVREGEQWVQSEGYGTSGIPTRFPDGTGTPDGEGISVGTDGALYLSVERDNSASGTSRNSILRVVPEPGAAELVATDEWNLTALLPATGPNSGMEAVEMVPANAFAHLGVEVPEAAHYAFVTLESTGDVYAVALHADGSAELLATLESPLEGGMALDHHEASNELWLFADEAGDGWSVIFDLDRAPVPAEELLTIDRMENVPNLAHEGVAIAPRETCTDDLLDVWFADDSATDGHSLRGTQIVLADCGIVIGGDDSTSDEVTEAPGDAAGGGQGSDDDLDPVDAGAGSPATGAPTSSAGQAPPVGTAPAGTEGRAQLARTGMEVTALALLAGALLVTGALLRRRSR